MQTKLVEVNTSHTFNVVEDTQFVLLVADYMQEAEQIIELVFNTQGVTAEIIMLYDVPTKGKLNVTTITRHVATNTACMTKVKGILNDKATSNYIGKILIEKGAQQTSSFLQDDVLVVGSGTKNNSQPILMIEADDVKASHGATTGRINEEEIYYLQSRGFSRGDAEQLIVTGFMQSLLTNIHDEKIRNTVGKKLLHSVLE